MNYKILSQSDTEVTLRITATPEELKHAREHAFDKYRPKVKVSGFRPGKAPDNIVSREIGDTTIQGEVMEHAVGHTYSDAIYQEKLAVIASPDVKIEKFVPYTELEYEATVQIVPPVKLPDYKKIKKTLKKPEVTKAQIDAMIDDLRRRGAERKPALRAAKMEDEVKLDFEGKRDGKPVPGASGKGYTLKLGSKTFIPGFEEEVVGLKVGDTKTFTVTFPKEYHEDSLAGKPVDFTVTIHEVTELVLPKLDDKLAAEVGPFKTVAELKTDVVDQLTQDATEKNTREFEQELVEEIATKSTVTVPDRLIVQQVERMKAEMAQRLASSGLDMDQYLEAQKQTQADLEAEIKPEAEKRVKLALVLSEVAKQEELKVSVEEIEAELAKLRQQYPDPAMQKELDGDQIKEDIYNHLMSGKTIKTLAEYATKK